ncbi:hypothetical protein IAU59_002877 [Kwoniella sp. CBS 9459]
MRSIRTVQPLVRRSGAVSLRSAVAFQHTAVRTTGPLISSAATRHYSSQITRRSGPTSQLGQPSENEYSNSAIYAFSYLSRIVRYVLYGVLALGGASIVTFEGLHLYVEKVCMAAPSRGGSDVDDPYGWIAENQGWTGGVKGGTDPRLGQKARHALRGAWICQQWGAGGSASSMMGKSTGRSFHPDFVAARGMIGQDAGGDAAASTRRTVDRGYELADEYVDLAVREARKKGLVFPPTLSGMRPAGPPLETPSSHGVPQGDPAVLDLFLLKAGILERINTPDALLHAKDLYETVLSSLVHAKDEQHVGSQSRVMRLAGKVGDLSARTGAGDEAMSWWAWGLGRAGVQMEQGAKAKINEVVKEVKQEAKGWFGWSSSSQKTAETSPIEQPSSSIVSPASTDPFTSNLTPGVLRASVSLLVSASAHLATKSSLAAASTLQSQALSLIPATSHIGTPTTSNAESTLHETWLQQRAALIKLHQSSVLHAQHPKTTDGQALQLVTAAQEQSEEIVSSIQPLPTAYSSPSSNALVAPAKLLRRDALLTGAESAYTRAVFLERSAPSLKQDDKRIHQLELAAEGFERAMTLSALECGVEKKDGDEVGQGEDWARYWRGYARVRGKLGAAVEADAVPTSAVAAK